MPPSVSRSSSSSAAALTVPALVTSGRLTGAATARTRIPLIFNAIGLSSFSLEPRLALLHERAAPFLVVGAFGAALHRGRHRRLVGLAFRLEVLLDDGLRVGDRQRRVLGQGGCYLED